MTYYYIIQALTLVVIVGFILMTAHLRKRDTVDARGIFVIFILVIISMAVDVADHIQDQLSGVEITDQYLYRRYYTVRALFCAAREVVILLIIIGWNQFVDYAVYKSFDHVKRKYQRAVIPALIVAVGVIAYEVFFTRKYMDDEILQPTAWVISYFCYTMQILYIVNAIYIVSTIHTKRNPPAFLHLHLFIIPFVVGYVWESFYQYVSGRFIGLAIGMILTWRTVEKRYKYMDPITGFYNKEFLSSMNVYMEKHGYPNGTGVYFKAPGSEGKLIPVLDALKPADSEVFSFGPDEYLLIAAPQKQSVIKLLIKSVKLGLSQQAPDLTVTADYAIKKPGESTEEFTKRLLQFGA